MNKDMATKKKLAKVPKYPYGGTLTPEEIQYREYLARTGQNVESARAIDEERTNLIESSKKKRATADVQSQAALAGGLGITQAIGGRTGQIGGIIGAAIGIGESIGAPIKAKAEKTYEIQYDKQGNIIEDARTGTLVNREKAGNMAALGFALAPHKIIGSGLFKGKYLSNIEDKAKAEYEQALAAQKEQKYYEDEVSLGTYDLKGRQGVEYFNKFGGKLPKYKSGGLSRTEDFGSTKKPYPTVSGSDFAGGGRSYPIPTKVDAIDALRLAGLHGRSDVRAKVFAKYPELNKMNDGGKLIPLASNIDLAKGNTHEQGGITLKNNGKPYAEIENNEVVVNDKVFSDESGHALIATKLGLEKGKYELDLATTDIHKKGTAERNIQKVDMKLNNLFNDQQIKNKDKQSKTYANMGGYIPKYQEGGYANWYNERQRIINENKSGFTDKDRLASYEKDKNIITNEYGKPDYDFYSEATSDIEKQVPRETGTIDFNTPSIPLEENKKQKRNIDYGKALDAGFNAARFVENIYNTKLIRETPEVPRPRLQQAARLSTEFNIEPALTESRLAFSDFAKSIDTGMTSANVGAANKAAAYAERLKRGNELYGTKANIESELKSKAALNAQEIAGRNLAKLGQYDINKYQREIMQQERKSANIANITEKISNIGTERQLKKLDESRISNIMKQYDKNPAAARKSYNEYYDSAKSTGELDKLKETLKKDKAGRELWNNDPRNENNQI